MCTMVRRAHGALEAEILRMLWQADRSCMSTEIRDRFPEPERPALTTVLTVLDRLEGKGLVVRRQQDGAAHFTPARPASQETAASMTRALAQSGDRADALLRFTGQLAPEDLAALRRALGQPQLERDQP